MQKTTEQQSMGIFDDVVSSISGESYSVLSAEFIFSEDMIRARIRDSFARLSNAIASCELERTERMLSAMEKDAVTFVATCKLNYLTRTAHHILMPSPLSSRQKHFQEIVYRCYDDRFRNSPKSAQVMDLLNSIGKSDNFILFSRSSFAFHDVNGLRNILRMAIEKLVSAPVRQLDVTDFEKHLLCLTFLLKLSRFFNAQPFLLYDFITDCDVKPSVFFRKIDWVLKNGNRIDAENILSLLKVIIHYYPFCTFSPDNKKSIVSAEYATAKLQLYISSFAKKTTNLRAIQQARLQGGLEVANSAYNERPSFLHFSYFKHPYPMQQSVHPANPSVSTSNYSLWDSPEIVKLNFSARI